ncbi:hypothetical protein FRB99_007485 [Tulasnella sp. 403]|nr:hypothetical protein FRB99_007485 [Tulasnella sp. 403]
MSVSLSPVAHTSTQSDIGITSNTQLTDSSPLRHPFEQPTEPLDSTPQRISIFDDVSVFLPNLPQPDPKVRFGKDDTWLECHWSINEHFMWVWQYMRLNYRLVQTNDVQRFIAIHDQYLYTCDNPPPNVLKPSLKERLAQHVLGKNPAHEVVREHLTALNKLRHHIQTRLTTGALRRLDRTVQELTLTEALLNSAEIVKRRYAMPSAKTPENPPEQQKKRSTL